MLKNKFSIFFIFSIIFMIFALMMYFGNNDTLSVYAFKIGDDKIGVGEYKMYLYEQKKLFEKKGEYDIWETDFDGVSAEEVAKQNAMNSIVMVKVAIKQSDRLNIALDNSEIQNIKIETESFYNELGEEKANSFELSKEDIYNILLEGALQKKIFNYITDGFQVSEADFNAYFNDYYEKNKSELNSVSIRYIFKSTNGINDVKKVGNTVEEIYSKVLSNENFEYLQNFYSDSSEKGVINIEKGMFEHTVEEAAYSLEEGQISSIIQTGDGFYIIKAVSVQKPDMDKLKEDIRKIYIQEKKQEIYQKQNQNWCSGYVIEKNEEVWKNISINEL